MHDTAFRIGCLAIDNYIPAGTGHILEIGSFDVNGSLRAHAPPGIQYTGLDFEAGPGVDLVVAQGCAWPVDDEQFDLVITSSALEHDPAFWNTFIEMCRKVKVGGYVYINVPSNGAVHRYPQDNWRFYPDSGRALAVWAQSQSQDIHLVESFVAMREADIWNDFVAVFRKSTLSPHQPPSFLHDLVPSANIWTENAEQIARETSETEDMAAARMATENMVVAQAELSEFRTMLETERENLAGIERELLSAREEQARLAGRITELESQSAQRQEELAQTSAERDHGLAERDHARAELELSKAVAERLRGDLAEADAWVFRLAGDRKVAEAAAERLSRELARLARAHQSDVRSLARSDADLTAVREQLARAQAKSRDLELAQAENSDLEQAKSRDLEQAKAALDAELKVITRQSQEWESQASELAQQNRRLAESLSEIEAAKNTAITALGLRFQEVATLSNLLIAQEAATAESLAQVAWLQRIAALSMAMPFWWRVLPHEQRRKRELRRLSRLGLFDGERYYELHPDVREAGMDPLQHYLLHGLSEGRAV